MRSSYKTVKTFFWASWMSQNDSLYYQKWCYLFQHIFGSLKEPNHAEGQEEVSNAHTNSSVNAHLTHFTFPLLGWWHRQEHPTEHRWGVQPSDQQVGHRTIHVQPPQLLWHWGGGRPALCGRRLWQLHHYVICGVLWWGGWYVVQGLWHRDAPQWLELLCVAWTPWRGGELVPSWSPDAPQHGGSCRRIQLTLSPLQTNHPLWHRYEK